MIFCVSAPVCLAQNDAFVAALRLYLALKASYSMGSFVQNPSRRMPGLQRAESWGVAIHLRLEIATIVCQERLDGAGSSAVREISTSSLKTRSWWFTCEVKGAKQGPLGLCD